MTNRPKRSPRVIVDVTQNVLTFYEHIVNDPHHRYRSWDHCYSYFQRLPPSASNKDIDLASLHLAFYLASWGMYRGSSFMLWKDYKIHTPAVRLVLDSDYRSLRNLDLNSVTAESTHVSLLFTLAARLKEVYVESAAMINGIAANRIPTDTLVTKILLGTLACTPAYDRLVSDGMRYISKFPATFNSKGYSGCINFFRRHSQEFKIAQSHIAARGPNYPQMKLMDMYFWSVGNQLDALKKISAHQP